MGKYVAKRAQECESLQARDKGAEESCKSGRREEKWNENGYV
nr:hypothetical protein [uncultured Acetatifactor sp.]